MRLTEEFLGLGGPVDAEALVRLRKWVEATVGRFEFEPAPQVVIGVAGTVTTLAAMVQGLTRYDAARVHASTLTRSDLHAIGDRLQGATQGERRAILLQCRQVRPRGQCERHVEVSPSFAGTAGHERDICW